MRRHYGQDVRERLNAYFGQSRPGQPRQPFDRGGQTRQGQPAARGRLAVSDSLSRSALVRGVKSQPSLREAAILLTGIHHPLLVEEEFAAFESLSLANSDLKALHATILDAHAEQREPSRADIGSRLSEQAGQKYWKLLTE